MDTKALEELLVPSLQKSREEADRAGTDFFLIGGSTDINSHLMDITIEKIRARMHYVQDLNYPLMYLEE